MGYIGIGKSFSFGDSKLGEHIVCPLRRHIDHYKISLFFIKPGLGIYYLALKHIIFALVYIRSVAELISVSFESRAQKLGRCITKKGHA